MRAAPQTREDWLEGTHELKPTRQFQNVSQSYGFDGFPNYCNFFVFCEVGSTTKKKHDSRHQVSNEEPTKEVPHHREGPPQGKKLISLWYPMDVRTFGST